MKKITYICSIPKSHYDDGVLGQPTVNIRMVLLKDESVKIMNDFDKKNRSAVMNLLTHHYSIPEFDADDILQDAWVFLMDKLMVGELHSVPEKLSAYLFKVCSYKAHEYLRKRQYEAKNISFDDDSISSEALNSYEMEAQSWDDFLEDCRRAEHKQLFLMEKELDQLSPRELSLLMGYYETDGSKTSMKELAKRLGYSSDRVAITLKSRIMKKLRTGIQQQEGALDNGLSPVAFLNYTIRPHHVRLWEFGREQPACRAHRRKQSQRGGVLLAQGGACVTLCICA